VAGPGSNSEKQRQKRIGLGAYIPDISSRANATPYKKSRTEGQGLIEALLAETHVDALSSSSGSHELTTINTLHPFLPALL